MTRRLRGEKERPFGRNLSWSSTALSRAKEEGGTRSAAVFHKDAHMQCRLSPLRGCSTYLCLFLFLLRARAILIAVRRTCAPDQAGGNCDGCRVPACMWAGETQSRVSKRQKINSSQRRALTSKCNVKDKVLVRLCGVELYDGGLLDGSRYSSRFEPVRPWIGPPC